MANPTFTDIELQPKQEALYDLVVNGKASWIGAGGGRGAAKSTAEDRIMLLRRTGLAGTIGAIVMRNYEQVRKYHIDPMLRDYPDLNDLFSITESKIVIPMKEGPPSEIHFRYAESLQDIERVFRSGNYYDVFVDQAEQFTKEELQELKKVVRWKRTDVGQCKYVLAFNMGSSDGRAAEGIGFLEKIFHSKEYEEGQDPEDYRFIQFNPWDNVEWVRAKLERDGRSPQWYYEELTDAEREQYCSDTLVGKLYKAQDPALRNRDWYGSFLAFEGAYFGRVFNKKESPISPDQAAALMKPYWQRWASMDWGFSHFAPTLWHATGHVSPEEAKEVLGWNIAKSLRVVVTYREYIAGGVAKADGGGKREQTEQEIGEEICKRTQSEERPLHRFFLSPDAFDLSVRRASQNQIAQVLGKVLRDGGLPYPVKADNSRVAGWKLMYNLLQESKRQGAKGGDCWLISENCPELSAALPLLMRDPKNLEDVLKTDEGKADLKQDMGDSARYGVKSMLAPGRKPQELEIEDELKKISDPTARSIKHLQMQAHYRKLNQPITRPRDWRSRMEEQ